VLLATVRVYIFAVKVTIPICLLRASDSMMCMYVHFVACCKGWQVVQHIGCYCDCIVMCWALQQQGDALVRAKLSQACESRV
jgi:hypothetical protein